MTCTIGYQLLFCPAQSVRQSYDHHVLEYLLRLEKRGIFGNLQENDTLS